MCDQFRQCAATSRLKRRHLVIVSDGRGFGVPLEADVHVCTKVVGGQRLGDGVGLVERHHGGSALAQLACQRACEPAEPAELADNHAAIGQ